MDTWLFSESSMTMEDKHIVKDIIDGEEDDNDESI